MKPLSQPGAVAPVWDGAAADNPEMKKASTVSGGGLSRHRLPRAEPRARKRYVTSLRRYYPDQVQGLEPRAPSQPADPPAPLVFLWLHFRLAGIPAAYYYSGFSVLCQARAGEEAGIIYRVQGSGMLLAKGSGQEESSGVKIIPMVVPHDGVSTRSFERAQGGGRVQRTERLPDGAKFVRADGAGGGDRGEAERARSGLPAGAGSRLTVGPEEEGGPGMARGTPPRFLCAGGEWARPSESRHIPALRPLF